MLSAKLLSAQSVGSLQFVGGRSATSSGQTPSYSLTGLTGGVSSAPAIGDIVIACVSIGNATNRDLQCTTSGYNEVADLYNGNSTFGYCQLGIYYKVLTAADTSVAFNVGVSTGSLFLTHVWRGVNATPLDAATVTVSNTTGNPNPPAITTTTNNAVVIAFGGASQVAANSLGIPSGMINGFASGGGGFYGIAIASALVSSASTYDPANFTGVSSIGGNRPSLAATMAIRSA